MSVPVLDAVLEDRKPSCCGTDRCNHTVLIHGHHQGYLVDGGRLYCDHGNGELQRCKLPASDTPCLLLEDLDGHQHGPDCGHEMVPHQDHFDYLVGDQLHHVVVDHCCPSKCVQTNSAVNSVVSHGNVTIVRRRLGIFNLSRLSKGTEVYVQLGTQEPATTTKIHAEGICCPSEVPIINNTLGRLDGVFSVDVSVVTKTVVVQHDASLVSPGVLVSALNGVNLGASLASNDKINQDAYNTQSWKNWIPPYHIIACFVLLMLSLVQYAGGRLEHFKWIALGSIAIGIWPILFKAAGALRACFLDIHILMTIAVAGAIAIGEYAEGAAVVFLFGLADWLEGKCTKHASNALAAVLQLQPDKALIKDTGLEVNVEEVQIGQVVIVKPGCKVPVDGVVLSGTTLIDQSMLTGESEPVFKAKGDQVLSGTLNTGTQAIEVDTTSLAEDSTASRIAKLVEEASRKKAPIERTVNTIAKFYTPALILATVLVIVIPLAMKVDDPHEWVLKGLVLLVSACPCAMVLSTPVTVVCGLARAAQKGVVIKGAQYLEGLGRCRLMTFDKTGTLTKGQVQLVHVGVFDSEIAEQQIVEFAAALEAHSPHPLAHAVMGYAAAKGYSQRKKAEVCENVPGEGLEGEIEGQYVFVGNERMVERVCKNFDQLSFNTLQKREGNGETIVFVGNKEVVWGYLALKDLPRMEAKEAVAEIRSHGVIVGMLTGDRKLVAQHIAHETGVDAQYVAAELFPRDKLTMVEKLKKEYKCVSHVGDGVNDCPALAIADVGIAMGVAGSAQAIETADIALFTSDLRQLAFALHLSRISIRNISINVTFSILVKVAVIILAFTQGVALWIAVLADVGSCMLVILFSMTILRVDIKREEGKSFEKGQCKYQAMYGKQCQDSCCGKKEQNHHHHKHDQKQAKSCCNGRISLEHQSVGLLNGSMQSHSLHTLQNGNNTCCNQTVKKSCSQIKNQSSCCSQAGRNVMSCDSKGKSGCCAHSKALQQLSPCCNSQKVSLETKRETACCGNGGNSASEIHKETCKKGSCCDTTTNTCITKLDDTKTKISPCCKSEKSCSQSDSNMDANGQLASQSDCCGGQSVQKSQCCKDKGCSKNSNSTPNVNVKTGSCQSTCSGSQAKGQDCGAVEGLDIKHSSCCGEHEHAEEGHKEHKHPQSPCCGNKSLSKGGGCCSTRAHTHSHSHESNDNQNNEEQCTITTCSERTVDQTCCTKKGCCSSSSKHDHMH